MFIQLFRSCDFIQSAQCSICTVQCAAQFEIHSSRPNQALHFIKMAAHHSHVYSAFSILPKNNLIMVSICNIEGRQWFIYGTAIAVCQECLPAWSPWQSVILHNGCISPILWIIHCISWNIGFHDGLSMQSDIDTLDIFILQWARRPPYAREHTHYWQAWLQRNVIRSCIDRCGSCALVHQQSRLVCTPITKCQPFVIISIMWPLCMEANACLRYGMYCVRHCDLHFSSYDAVKVYTPFCNSRECSCCSQSSRRH
jgi:hypothetical protein